ncbi:hypothetical protein [Gayadomonas joobiniege]|uniref:hypothetical protein n=1 Tax=Gayadomonas joobiniege TaxID=1234606 RepID=UPI000371B151|nr:hypothetical protein [Gayadomonas joobiniege]
MIKEKSDRRIIRSLSRRTFCGALALMPFGAVLFNKIIMNGTPQFDLLNKSNINIGVWIIEQLTTNGVRVFIEENQDLVTIISSGEYINIPKRISQDFHEGKVVKIEGFVFSKTEALLCIISAQNNGRV